MGQGAGIRSSLAVLSEAGLEEARDYFGVGYCQEDSLAVECRRNLYLGGEMRPSRSEGSTGRKAVAPKEGWSGVLQLLPGLEGNVVNLAAGLLCVVLQPVIAGLFSLSA